MSKEIWKDIQGYEGKYQISNFGNVKSLERYVKNKNGLRKVCEKQIKPYLNNRGYFAVSLTTKHKSKLFFVHRLIAKSFIPNPENKPQINHKDCNPKNNNINNLEWSTQKENVSHAIKNGRYENVFRVAKIPKLNHNTHLKKEVIQKDIDGNVIKKWEGIKVASRNLGLSDGNIIKACKGVNHTCGGYVWEYA